MHYKSLVVASAFAVSTAIAQRPDNTSICDYYTTALLMNNTAANQYKLLTLVVNTAVIGNYTTPNVGIAVPGILAPGKVDNEDVDLLPYFNGGFASSNRGGSSGVAINFLDGGGADALKMNMPANDTSSHQYMLLTHLYEFFGVLLGCSMQGGGDYPAYAGQGSQYKVHQFMDLKPAQLNYFISQVALSASSFGVSASDLAPVGAALDSLFNVRCADATTVVPDQGPQLQSICQDSTCPLAANNSCETYPNNGTAAMKPVVADAALVPNGTASSSSSGSPSATGTATESATGTQSSKAAAVLGCEVSFLAVGLGAFAFFL